MVPFMALLYVGLVGVHGYFAYERDCDQLIERLDSFVSSRSIILAEPIWTGQHDQVKLILASMIADRDISYIAIYNHTGRIIDSFGKPESTDFVFDKKSSITFADQDNVHRVGFLEVKASNDFLLRRLWDDLIF